MKKLFWIMPLILLTITVFSCGNNSVPSTSITTQPPAGTVSEATVITSNIDITSTPSSTGNTQAPNIKNVSVIAEKNNVAVGDSFEVVVAVDIMKEMSRGATCGLAWTPSNLVECTKVADGDFFKDFGPVDIGVSGTKAIHNDDGIVDTMAQFCTGEPVDSGAAGKGVLYIYYFTAKEKGEVTFSIPKDSLVISNVTADASITVEAYNTATVTIK